MQKKIDEELKRSGLLLDQPEVLRAMEHDALTEPRYLPLKIKKGSVELLTVEDLYERIAEYDGSFETFIQSTGKHYVEVQLWSDKYVK